ncbi:hypothetical protein QBC46DRAFT_46583 [Diplogelasinospora grovesii]|uniref:Uncharacterized protein n=1 Tax=Diplogelasinospora grovesii TaxID=303347 RepID=A0AAN6MYQ2_9PEZI|nr:hypothetical protein QBC46DRAFT_46583 [Diplogelasinospora grovesii]
MKYQLILSTTFTLIALGRAAPLNINLGAYSPALVVGDGAIEFEEGGEAVTNIVNTLQGAAVSGAAAAANREAAPAAPAAPAGEGAGAGVVEAAVAPSVLTEPATLPVPGSSKELDPRVQEQQQEEGKVQKRQAGGGFDRALLYAEQGLTKGPKVQLGTGAKGSGVGIIVDNNQAVAALPGTGITVER